VVEDAAPLSLLDDNPLILEAVQCRGHGAALLLELGRDVVASDGGLGGRDNPKHLAAQMAFDIGIKLAIVPDNGNRAVGLAPRPL